MASIFLLVVLKKAIRLSMSSKVVVSSIVIENAVLLINLKLIPSSTDLLNHSLALESSMTIVSKYLLDLML